MRWALIGFAAAPNAHCETLYYNKNQSKHVQYSRGTYTTVRRKVTALDRCVVGNTLRVEGAGSAYSNGESGQPHSDTNAFIV